ncbi:MAG: RluA family pseudouridine synthase [Candidatus Sericytochromatia bacterium]|nr:RluA family pseudouridine synthase [Candidatus Sericytochromatia bacterium]
MRHVGRDPRPLRPHPALPRDLPLPIRHLDDDVVVVAKPGGMATHPGPGWWQASCVNALLHAVPHWPGVGGVAGPGIVHRLDRDTSGLLVFARSDRAHRPLLEDAAAHRLGRVYLAWVEGVVAAPGEVDAPLGRDDDDRQQVVVREDGKAARTRYAPVAIRGGRTLLQVWPETGRTHQIRVHLAHRGWPIVGDVRYGTPGEALLLHAWHLALTHPGTGEACAWTEPPPATWGELGEGVAALCPTAWPGPPGPPADAPRARNPSTEDALSPPGRACPSPPRSCTTPGRSQPAGTHSDPTTAP